MDIKHWFQNLGIRPRVLLLGFFLLVASACGLPWSSARVGAPPDENLQAAPGRVAFIGGDQNVYTIAPDGSQRQALTTDAQVFGDLRLYQYPTWSPDGRQVAFVSVEDQRDALHTVSVHVANADGSDLRQLYSSDESFPFYLYWSPDSQYLSFLSSSGIEDDLTLQLVSEQGGEPQVLSRGSPFYWVWAPDSRRLALHAGGSRSVGGENARLAFLDLESSADEQQLDLAPTFFQAPAWSPDGQSVLVAAEGEAGQAQLFLMDAQGAVLQQLAAFDGNVAFGWAPDGQRLAYLVTQLDPAQGHGTTLNLLRPDGSQALGAIPADFVLAFFWSPDGQKIAYFLPDFAIPAGERAQVGPPEEDLMLHVYILDVDSGNSHQAAVFEPSEDFLSVLSYFDQYQHSATLWSPDSRYLLLSAIDADRQPVILVADTSGTTEPWRLADGVLAFWSWH